MPLSVYDEQRMINLSETEEIEELKAFWVQIADEEKRHTAFWNTAKETAQGYRLHPNFELLFWWGLISPTSSMKRHCWLPEMIRRWLNHRILMKR